MRFDDPTNPAAWLLGSFLALVLATTAGWLVVRRHASDPTFRRGPLAAAAWLCLSLFYLLLPFAALQRGVVSPYALGLTEINWPATLSNGMILAGLIAAGLLFGWLVYRRAGLEEPSAEGVAATEPARSSPAGVPAALARLLSVLVAPLDAALQQWHWAFYRAAAIGWLLLPLSLPAAPLADRLLQGLQREPLYWGAWIGLAVTGLECRSIHARPLAAPWRSRGCPAPGGTRRRHDGLVRADPQLLAVPRSPRGRRDAGCRVVSLAPSSGRRGQLNHKGPGSPMSRALVFAEITLAYDEPQDDQTAQDRHGRNAKPAQVRHNVAIIGDPVNPVRRIGAGRASATRSYAGRPGRGSAGCRSGGGRADRRRLLPIRALRGLAVAVHSRLYSAGRLASLALLLLLRHQENLVRDELFQTITL
jgi:hypothetical protein